MTKNLAFKIAWKLMYEKHYSLWPIYKARKDCGEVSSAHKQRAPPMKKAEGKGMPSTATFMLHVAVLKNNCLDTLAVSKLLALNIQCISWVK